MTKQIPLSQGKVALIDDEDFERISKYKWYARKTGYVYYAVRKIDNQAFYMHREILGVTDRKIDVDHCNGDGLDNRRENLREATRSQNIWNTGKRKHNRSGYKGVYLHDCGKYAADINMNRKTYHLGLFETAEQAARAYDEESKKLRGAFAYLNFPEE